jgi:L-ascorbate metabolism protein UlaG (beta-lactamase superfamily)
VAGKTHNRNSEDNLDITYLGAGSIKLSGKTINVVFDPYDESAGLGKFNAKTDLVLLSGPEGYAKLDEPFVIDGPGEYEVKSASITGVPAQLHIDESGHRGTVYSVDVDGVNVVFTGNISGKLDAEQVENLGQIDVLVVPVGGHGLTLDAEGAAAVVAQLEPSFVVPVHYDDGASKYTMPQDGVDLFLKEMGANPEPESKFRISQSEPGTETQVILLTRAGS